MISAECELEPLQAPSPRDERRTSAYLAGWALLKVTKAVEKTKGLAHLKPALAGLSLPQGSSLPADDPAAGYLAARQQFGALTIPSPSLIDAFTLARHMLTLKQCLAFTGKVAVITTVLITLGCGMVKFFVVW